MGFHPREKNFNQLHIAVGHPNIKYEFFKREWQKNNNNKKTSNLNGCAHWVAIVKKELPTEQKLTEKKTTTTVKHSNKMEKKV